MTPDDLDRELDQLVTATFRLRRLFGELCDDLIDRTSSLEDRVELLEARIGDPE